MRKIVYALIGQFLFIYMGIYSASPQGGPPSRLEVTRLRCEYLTDPMGIDVRRPRLFWKLEAKDEKVRGQRQTAYRVLVSSTEEKLGKDEGDLWDSGEVASDRSVHVEYGGKPLSSGMACHWKVRVKDQDGALSSWSRPARFTLGLLEPSDWKGKWIGTGKTFEREKDRSPADKGIADPWLRKTFSLEKRPRRALAYVASVGYHELYVNGKKAGSGVLSPSATDHKVRARYVTYDISEHLRSGENALGLWLGLSWSIFPQYTTPDKPRSPIVLAQVEIEGEAGETLRIVTDDSWKTHPSPSALLGVWDFMNFGGELYDARREVPLWCEAGLDDSSWKPASVFQPKLILSSEKVEPNRPVKEISPVAIAEPSPGIYRADMGVNFAGWIEIDLRGSPGDRIDLRFSERPDQEMTHNLRSAYILGPEGKGTFRNRFNYSVGRWITVKGLRQKPELREIRGWLVRTDYRRTGRFRSSSPLLGRIYETALWTFENLSLGGYVVDCPQRERMGYGGDAHATTATALGNYDLGAFYTKWSEDWRDVQGVDGNLPYTAPTYWGGGGPGWSGFCITLPWEIYLRYGDVRILEENLPTIERWLRFLETKASEDLLRRWGGEWDFLGDWLWPGAEGVNGDTPETLFFNNCYWIYNLQTAAKIQDILGKRDAAEILRKRARAVRRAAHEKFFRPEDSSYANGFPAYLAIALLTEVPPEETREAVWKRLEREILEVRKGHIHAGITGGAFLLKALIEGGKDDWILAMATKEDYPGWGDMLRKGATTFWEDWEGKLSLLHSSYLHIGRWFIEGLAGIRPHPEKGGFQDFLIRPGICGSPPLGWVEGEYDSLHGIIRSAWRIEGGKFRLKVTVPPNTKATVFIPTSKPDSLREGSGPAQKAKGIDEIRIEGKNAVLRLGSGTYDFEADG